MATVIIACLLYQPIKCVPVIKISKGVMLHLLDSLLFKGLGIQRDKPLANRMTNPIHPSNQREYVRGSSYHRIALAGCHLEWHWFQACPTKNKKETRKWI
jgi:hypothetical protein